MKPLLAVITYNRITETVLTLESLCNTGAMEQAQVVVWDNNSLDGTTEAVHRLWDAMRKRHKRFRFIWSAINIGCPQALNEILHTWPREPRQDFIKVDNDVELLTLDWVNEMQAFMDAHPEVGMASPWYAELETANLGRLIADRGDWLEHFPVVGHCCYHRADVLDRSGYFDVLAPDHLYGFEDLLMAHRAAAMGYKCAIVKGIILNNLQRHNSLDVGKEKGTNREGRAEHTERLRPLYEDRLHRIHNAKGRYRVNANGMIVLE